MSVKPAAPLPSLPAPAPAVAPSTEYERFLAALPESFRDECRSKLDGSGLAANHPVFHALAELYEKEASKPARDFIQEATLHADRATQLLNDFQNIPRAILAQVEPQVLGLVSALNGPLQKLEALSTAAPPHLRGLAATVSDQASPIPNVLPEPSNLTKKEAGIWQRFGRIFGLAGSTVSNPMAWLVTGSVSAAFAVMIFSLGATHLSNSYEVAYQDRLAHMEADSAVDTVALNRLLVAGITLKVERSPDANAWYLILPGAHKATSRSIHPRALPSRSGRKQEPHSMNPTLPPKREPTPDQIIFALIKSFPCLAIKVRQWLVRATEFDPDEFHRLFERASSGEVHCALFILNVWSHSYAVSKGWRFDLVAFVNCADGGNRKALLDWIIHPHWP